MAYKFYETPMIGASNYFIRLGYEVTGQNIGQNTSTVKYVMYIGFNGGGTGLYNLVGDSALKLTVNGEIKRDNTSVYDFRATRLYTISEGTQTIKHDEQGKATFTMEGYWDPALAGYHSIRETTAKLAINLPDLATTKTFKLERSSMNFGTSQTITINNHSSGYSYEIRMTRGNNVWKMGETSTGTFRLTVGTNFLSIVPNTTSTTVTVVVTTKLGNRVLGEEVQNLTLVVPDNYRPNPPSVSFNNLDQDAIKIFNSSLYYLSQTSTMGVQAIPQGNLWGTTINYFEFRIAGRPYEAKVSSSAMTTMGAFTFHKGETKAYQLQARVRDSRGRFSGWATASSKFYVLEYESPKIFDIKAERSGDGTSVVVSRSYAVSPLLVNGSNNNTAEFTFETRKLGLTNWVPNAGAKSTALKLTESLALLSGTFSPTESYEVKAILRDDFSTVEMVVPLGTEAVPLDVSQDGVGVGKVHEPLKEGTLQVNGAVDATEYLINGKPFQPTGNSVGMDEIRGGVEQIVNRQIALLPKDGMTFMKDGVKFDTGLMIKYSVGNTSYTGVRINYKGTQEFLEPPFVMVNVYMGNKSIPMPTSSLSRIDTSAFSMHLYGTDGKVLPQQSYEYRYIAIGRWK